MILFIKRTLTYLLVEIQFSDGWMDQFLKNYSNELELVKGYPLEEERANISIEQLKFHMT